LLAPDAVKRFSDVGGSGVPILEVRVEDAPEHGAAFSFCLGANLTLARAAEQPPSNPAALLHDPKWLIYNRPALKA
jgi:hypothetical protein